VFRPRPPSATRQKVNESPRRAPTDAVRGVTSHFRERYRLLALRDAKMVAARLGLAGSGIAALFGVVAWAMRPALDRAPVRLLTQAQADYEAGHYRAAADALARVARLRAPTPGDRMARALVARARGEDALAELAHIPGDHPLAAQAELWAGQIELECGRLRRAEAHFLAALVREPNDVHAHRELAFIYNLQHRQHELDAQMNALSELNALSFDLVLHWSKTRNAVWNPTTDCESLAKYLAADPDDRYSRLALVDGLRQLGRLEGASSVLAHLPDSDVEARIRRALLAFDAHDSDRADQFLAGGPVDHPGLAALRGQLALSRGDAREAVHLLRIAAAAQPDDRATLSALATAQRLAGDEVGAKAQLEMTRRHAAVSTLIKLAATPSGPRDPTLPARLGAACEAAGRLAEARAWYRLAIARDPLDTGPQQALFRLSLGAAGNSRSHDDVEPHRD
jgi:tetratricopeptide (TPR) repeat protein